MQLTEEQQHRLKRLRHRSRQRGFNEMDRILGSFATVRLADLDDALLTEYEALLDLPDWDAFGWLAGDAVPPDAVRWIVSEIRTFLKESLPV